MSVNIRLSVRRCGWGKRYGARARVMTGARIRVGVMFGLGE